MRKWKWPTVSLVLLATVLVWLKTYLVYKTSFDINIENSMQEFILFINPISFLLFMFGIGLFMKSDKKRNRFIFIVTTILAIILYGNVAFYRFFTDFLTLPVLFQTSNFGDLGNSAGELVQWTDIFFFTDVIILAVIMKIRPKMIKFDSFTSPQRRAYFLVALAMMFFNLGLAETERPQLLTRTFDREMLVKNIGTYNYHLYDMFLQSKSSAQRALADGSELTEIENYVKANYVEPDDEMFGIAKDKNLIVISLESLQSFVINNEMNGEVVTPFLNEFIGESIYFDNFYHQTQQGKTSDSEFLLDNSMYPSNRGAVFFTGAVNEYNSLTERLNENDYFTSVMHANRKSFWNRDIMYDSLGYDRFYSVTDYEVTEENKVGWGLKDKPFFDQSIEHIQEMPQPFFTKMITLTNHHPFDLEDEEDILIEQYDSNSNTLNKYFQTVRYMDEAVEEFVNDLKESGIYDDSIIVMYGDHYGISELHNPSMAQYLGKEVTPLVSTQLQRVPLIIHIPGMEGKVMSEVSGQLDLRPTLLHLLGMDTSDDIQFGSDLFSEDFEEFTILRDGRFITEDIVYAGEKCWDKNTEQELDMSVCEPYLDRVEEELSFSERIITGDLLRFYGKEDELETP
ncbi:LTA synthase family protein [Bacillus spongiae]|uniref:LTA synthase family protein n=1 Tax=Bacillus spongiae TaxID=2683610 RepID=A0ABU8H9D0_9BACI